MARLDTPDSFYNKQLGKLQANTTGDITAEDMQEIMRDIADSFAFTLGEITQIRLRFNTRNTNMIQVQVRKGSLAWEDAGQLDIGTIGRFNQVLTNATINLNGNSLLFAHTRGGTNIGKTIDLGTLPKFNNYYTKNEANGLFARTSNVHSIEDLIYTPEFRQEFAARVGRYINASNSTFFVDDSLQWAYPEQDNPTYQDDTSNPVSNFDFFNFYGKWITLKSNISSPSFPLRVNINNATFISRTFQFVLVEVRDNPVNLILTSTRDNITGQTNINLDVGWHSLVFLRKNNGVHLEHKPFIDKTLLDAFVARDVSLLDQRLRSLLSFVYAQWNGDAVGNNLTITSEDYDGNETYSRVKIEDTYFIRQNYTRIEANPYAVQNKIRNFEQYTPQDIFSGSLTTASKYVAVQHQAETRANAVDRIVFLTLGVTGNEHFIWNQDYASLKLQNSNFKNGSFELEPGHVLRINTSTTPWTTNLRTAIDTPDLHDNSVTKEKLSTELQESIGGANLDGIPFATHNKGIDLDAFVAEPLKADISLGNKTKAALTPGQGADVTNVTIQLVPTNTYEIWNRATHPVTLNDNKFPENDRFTIKPAHIYSFKLVNNVWHIKNIVVITEDELSDGVKAQIATPISSERLMWYWNAYGRKIAFTGDPADWDEVSVNRFATHTVGSTQYPTLALLGSRNTEYHTFKQGDTFTDKTEALFSIVNGGVTTLFVWNQFRNHSLIVGFVSEDGHEITNVGDIFGTDAQTSPTVLEPGEMRLFFIDRKDRSAQGSTFRELDATKTLARNPFKPTPRFFGEGTIDTINLRNDSVTEDKVDLNIRTKLNRISGVRFADLYCDSALEGRTNTVGSHLALIGQWQNTTRQTESRILHATIMGEHFDFQKFTLIHVLYSSDTNGTYWTSYDDIPQNVNGYYNYEPIASIPGFTTNETVMMIIRLPSNFNILTGANTKHFRVFIDIKGRNSGIGISNIREAFFTNTNNVTNKTQLIGKSVLDTSKSYFN